MSFIPCKYIIVVLLLMVTIFASKIEDEITNSMDSINIVPKSEKIELKKHSLDGFILEIHRIIFTFLDTKHQGFYSLLTRKLLQSKVREFYLCKRAEDVLIYGRDGEKSNVYVNPETDKDFGFDKYFRLRMKNLPEIDVFFSRTREKLSELWEFKGILEKGAQYKYIYHTTTGKIQWDNGYVMGYALPIFPLAIKFTVKGNQYVEFLRRYQIKPANLHKSAINHNCLELRQNLTQTKFMRFSCEFNFNTNLDTLTDVKELYLGYSRPAEFLAAEYIISDNTEKWVLNPRFDHKELTIDSLIFADTNSTSNFKIINSLQEDN